MTQPKPWERQPDETPQAFEAFARYRDMPGRRSMDRVAKELHKSHALMGRWSVRHRWVERAAAFDAAEDEAWREEVRRTRVALARKHAAVGAAMLTKAVARLQSINPDTLSPNELERWMRTATEIEARAMNLDDAEENAVKAAAGAITELVRGLRATG
ncbi:MAG TPA: hypothetical protein VFV01_47660 [Spirillospora sp.]|nr:hypothetical protein [Spirillospora sp.]